MHKSIKHIIGWLLLAWLCVQETVQAQQFNPRVRKVSIKDGLSNRFVNGVFQDSRGFIWIGCNYGLNRYDGTEMKFYTKEDHGLKRNHVRIVLEMNDSLLAIIHSVEWNEEANFYQTEVSFFDPIQEQTIPFHEMFPSSISETDIQSLGNGFLIGIDNTIYLLEKGEETLYGIRKLDVLPSRIISNQLNNKDEWLIVANVRGKEDDGIYRLTKDGLSLVGPVMGDGKKQVRNLKGFYEDMHNNIFYSGNGMPNEHRKRCDTSYAKHANFLIYKMDAQGQNEVFCLNGKVLDYDTYHDEDARIIFLEELGIMVVPSYRAFDVYDLDGNFIMRTEDVLELLDIRNYMVDDNNRIWLGTTDGCYVVDFRPELFTKYLCKPNVDPYATPQYGSGNGIRGICEDREGNLWVSNESDYSLIKIDKNGVESPSQVFKDGQDDYYNAVIDNYAMYRDKNGLIWTADSHYSLFLFDPKKENFQRFTYPELKNGATPDYSSSNRPWANRAIYVDENRVWIGQIRGLSFMDKAKGYLEQYEAKGALKGIQNVYDFYKNDAGLWIGAETGLYLFNLETETAERFSPNGKGDYYLPHGSITNIHEDKYGIFWMTSSSGGGLLRWNPITKRFKKYTAEDGLAHNVTYAVYEDDFGYLWISSDAGVMRFHKESEQVDSYLPQDGLPHVECNTIAHYQGDDGTIYFGTLNGIAKFHPKNFHEQKGGHAPKLQITNYQVLDKSTGNYIDQTAQLLTESKIVMEGNYQAFILHFALLDYFAPEQNSYAYQIEGMDGDWNYIDGNVIRIGNLDYGNYTLKIKGRGMGGLWSPNELTIPIVVPMPFYLQWWFILGMLLLIVFGVYTYVQWRLNRLKAAKAELEREVQARTHKIAQQTEELKALDKVKSRFFANISHELRTPLTLIIGPLSQLLQRKKIEERVMKSKLQVMEKNGKQLLGLINEILDLSKLESSELEVHPEPVLLEGFAKRIFYSFESGAAYKDIKLCFENEVDSNTTVVLDKQKVEKILNNLLSNALKFTGAGGEIHFNIKATSTVLNISVMDTGEGIHPNDIERVFDRFYQSKQPNQPAQGGTGIGLALSKELAELLEGKLEVESIWKEGSTFTLTLPMKLAEDAVVDEVTETDKVTKAVAPIVISNFPEHQYTVLIVEDNLDMQAYTQSIVAESYKTITAENGEVALQILKEQGREIDLIVSDVMMPKMDGFQLLEQLKSTDAYRGIPVIMLTARVALEDKLHALRVGVDDYLTKPFVADELLVRMHNLLRNYQQRREWQEEIAATETSVLVEEINTAKEPVKEVTTIEIPLVSEEDQNWLVEVEQIVEQECGNNNFTVDWLSSNLAISPRQLQRRLKKLTGLTPKKYITEVRLQTARSFLENKKYNTVNQVMHAVGFKKQSYFSKLFEERFGVLPRSMV